MKTLGLNSFQNRFLSGHSNSLGVVPVAAATTVAPTLLEKLGPVITKIKPLANALAKAKELLEKIPIGGVKQTRFLNRRDEFGSIFSAAGYTGGKAAANWPYTWEKLKLLAADIPDRLKTRSYKKEFNRLYTWVVNNLEFYNPGLGKFYASVFPEFKMATNGNIKNEYTKILKEIVQAIPPGKYTPALDAQLRAAWQNSTSAAATLETVAPDEVGDPTDPTPEYDPSEKASSGGGVQAGFGWIGAGVLALAVAGIAMSSGEKKKAA